ncbi:metallophosphoesterase [Bythopirellula polymerisocia]|uniref:Calcineurin-like phosphoesterase n=1 Tax=Bythopirellula polymerisocia TaxID=2528003 RepID=A0A5C6CR51_9BACT|nr:metallophosphoesterase [Bythopirellula polymerisocia]TWU26017.1 Calcineurin-like phosphoesterase [Bythopirellula polymerisocia]
MNEAILRISDVRLFLSISLLTILLCNSKSADGIDSIWNFEGDLSTSVGSSLLSYRGDTATFTSFGTTGALGLPSIYGSSGSEQVMAFPAATPSQGYTVTHGGSPLVQEYTMVWDVLYPESSDIQWRSLMQTSVTNGNDGDLFVRNVPWGGIGISGQYHGAIRPDEWNRIAVTRDSTGTWHKYINGGYVGEQDASSSRFALDPTFHLFADESNDTAPGYVSSYRYLDRAMSSGEILQLGGANAQGTGVAGQVFATDPATVSPGSYSIAILGDTQNYSQFRPDIYSLQTQWLADNASSRNIQMVLHVGDVVNFDDTTQWNNAAAAMSTLDNAQVPYAIAPGNHDYANNRNVTQFNQANRFGSGSPYANQSTLGGNYPAEPNSMLNTFHTFEANGEKTIIMALEFGPRDEVINWANAVLDSHPDHRAILLTHAYMFDGGRWFDASHVDPNDPMSPTYDQIRDGEVNHTESIYNPHSYGWATGANDGKELWDKLVKGRENMPLVITGHQFDELDGFPYQLEQADNGNDVYQLLVDQQNRTTGGEGWIRFLEFSADGHTVTVKSYSPYLDQWSYASDEFFTIELSPISQPIAGDFDEDGDVDGNDFLVWQRGGSPNELSAEDLLAWDTNYGLAASLLATGTTMVPESSTLLMLAGFASLMGVWSRRVK